ncbi:EF-hand domain-containing protein [Catenovulum agarivorans]|uniref:EF-hand domain-containing protein n=1 Tax=Catenovulum agarivorans TaxID=1172192 RepID=UPI0002E7BD7D|nr:EF-hand domain-containing protein [Catenovulum agarivorans]
MKILSTAILASLLTVAVSAHAETNQGTEGKEKKRVSPIHKLFDTNKDGVIDAGEISNATTVLNGLDSNQDGQLDKVDFAELREQHKGKKGPKHCPKKGKKPFGHHPREMFKKKDVNKDGVLDSTEVKAEFIAKFDADQDGVVSKQEIKEHFQAKRAENKAAE